MTEVIIKEYEKKGVLDKIYIGHQDTEISQELLEDLKYDRNIAEKKYKEATKKDEKERTYNDYSSKFLNYLLKNQQEILAEKKALIKLTRNSFTLNEKNGEVLNKLTDDQMKGEFAWFCTSPYLLKNQSKNRTFNYL